MRESGILGFEPMTSEYCCQHCCAICPLSHQTLGFFHRYESLRPGNPEVAAEYKGKLYCFASDEQLDKFMRY